MRKGGLFGLTWPFCLRLPCPFCLPCILSPEPRARGRSRRERKRTLAVVKLAFPHPQRFEAMSDVQEPLSWGKSTATEAVLEQLVDDRLLPVNINSERPAWIPPAAGGDRTESPRGLRRESRATPRAGIQRPRR